jgi:hypothetical protein
MPEFMPPAPQPVASPATFKVLTCNTLHGVEVSQLRVRQVEAEKQQRRAQHLQLLTQGLLVKEMANCGRGGKRQPV